jgi:universal stress protein A
MEEEIMKIKPAKRARCVTLEVGPGDSRMLAQPRPSAADTPFCLKRILAPVDFSECSQKALQYAVPFCAQFQAALVLLHVVEVPYVASDVPVIQLDQWQAQMNENAISRLAALKEGPNLRGLKVEQIIRIGNPYREIVAAAKEMPADLIILSTHGHTGFSRMFMGSTAERVVRHASCPVLVVRENEHEFIQEPGVSGRFANRKSILK